MDSLETRSDTRFYVMRAVRYNVIYWIAFWAIFACMSHPCVKNAHIDECVIFGRTFSGRELPWPEKLLIAAMVVQIPSILISEAVVLPLFAKLGLSPISHPGTTSATGYVLILATFLSLLQWAGTGWLIARFWRSRPQSTREQSVLKRLQL